MSKTLIDRAQAMLLGLHAGDALGAPLEFRPPVSDLSHTEITGGGDLNWRPGEATDDTELMIFVLKSMSSLTDLDLASLRHRLIQWHDTHPPDIGNTTRAGIRRLINGASFGGLAEDPSESNGSIMRVAPLALMQLTQERLHELIRQQAALTHGNPGCAVADQILIGALRLALSGEPREKLLAFIMNEAQSLGWRCDELEQSANASWNELKTSGLAVHSLGAAVWALKNARNFEDALIRVVNRGDDSDTAGAVVGALFGAMEGVDAIPDRWLEKLERRDEILAELDRLLT